MRRLALLIAILLTLPTASAQGHFDAPWVGYNAGDEGTGRYTVRLLADDFTGDGYPDLVVGRAIWNTGFAFLRNRGDGTYDAPVHYESANATWGLAVGDFDGDGDLDLLASEFETTEPNGNTVALFENDGAGVFAEPVQVPAGEGPTGLAVADFDGDGALDFAVAGYDYIGTGNTISIVFGDGAGGFALPVTYVVEEAPFRIEAGDLDGDGDPDLAVAHDEYNLSLLFNAGDGAFSAPTVYQATPRSASAIYPDVALSDLDGDGDLDVVYTNLRTWDSGVGGYFVLYTNDGDGGLTHTDDVFGIPFSAGPGAIEVADVSGDGVPDLLGAHFNGRANDGVMVVLADDAGGYEPAQALWAGQYTVDLALTDVDLDGDLDVTTVDWYSMEATVQRNPGDGRFAQTPLTPTGALAGNLSLGDADGDGDLDAFAAGDRGLLHLNDGTGAFGPGITIDPFGKQGAFGDVDGDGDEDLLIASRTFGVDLYVAFNDGAGSYGAPVSQAVGGCRFDHVQAHDVDGDGDLDAVGVRTGTCPPDNDFVGRLLVSMNDGTGTFGPVVQTLTEPWASAALDVADFDRDGALDFVIPHNGFFGDEAAAVVLYSNGDGTVRQLVTVQGGLGPNDVVAADVNGDGWPDVATSNTGADAVGQETMSVALNVGGVGFGPATVYYAPRSPDLLAASGIDAGDIDGDGDLDLLMSNVGSNDVAAYINDGAGGFTFPARYGVAASASDVIYADVTGDGLGDLVTLAVMRPAGFPSALAVVPGRTGTQPAPVTVRTVSAGGPILVGPDGGSFPFTVVLTNQSTRTQTVQAWTAVTGPAQREPVLEPRTVTLPPAATVTQTLEQWIPGVAPPGRYTYHVRVGTLGEAVVASDGFPFEKAAGAMRDGAPTGGWTVTGWDDAAATAAEAGVALSPVYPNPARGAARVALSLGAAQAVRVEAYDALGRRVAVLHEGQLAAGPHELTLDGSSLPAGVYVLRVTGERFTATQRFTRLD
ncbi:MAG: FG-GAP-like repeat-containing protein [Rubricoccaceae bacterium]|nr:FG-GAP-like repeat-containing protein [Rubricoccaceae bacterium]